MEKTLTPLEIAKGLLHRSRYLQNNEAMMVPVNGMRQVLNEYLRIAEAPPAEPEKRGPGRPKKVKA